MASNTAGDDDVDGEAIPPTSSDATTPAASVPHTYTAEDGTVYYWDGINNMWLPQVCTIFFLLFVF